MFEPIILNYICIKVMVGFHSMLAFMGLSKAGFGTGRQKRIVQHPWYMLLLNVPSCVHCAASLVHMLLLNVSSCVCIN